MKKLAYYLSYWACEGINKVYKLIALFPLNHLVYYPAIFFNQEKVQFSHNADTALKPSP